VIVWYFEAKLRENFDYSNLVTSGINKTLSQNISVSSLSLDGDYLVKGYYNFSASTEYLGQLGKNIDTAQYRVISGNALTGDQVGTKGYLGFYHHQITVLLEGKTPKFTALQITSNAAPGKVNPPEAVIVKFTEPVLAPAGMLKVWVVLVPGAGVGKF
jgi:hypothetical protein